MFLSDSLSVLHWNMFNDTSEKSAMDWIKVPISIEPVILP